MTFREMDRTMIDFLRRNGERIAYQRLAGRGPGLVWLGGFHSDMNGTKAQAVAAFAAREGRACVRFDYFGHGASSGAFANGTISRWRDDALAVLDEATTGPQVLVGSSMGGWITTLVAAARPERVAAVVLIAPAPDLTEELMWKQMPPEIRTEITETGSWDYHPEDGEGYPITRGLIEDGRQNLVLGRALALDGPVRILHGTDDRDVPWQHGAKLLDVYSGDVTFTLVKGAGHRLSSAANLHLIEQAIANVVKDIAPC
jgi:pimeloyl-ACP methyl ester carboxylesterase